MIVISSVEKDVPGGEQGVPVGRGVLTLKGQWSDLPRCYLSQVLQRVRE